MQTASFQGRPALTHFFLAGQRWIVFNLDLTACRLVTLSACESGRADIRSPDEFLGLPAAFLRAGAAEVIGTLWRVDDVATMLLVGKLYEGMLQRCERPAKALQSAQLWLRDATNRSLHELYQAMRDSPDSALKDREIDRELRRHALAPPDDCPYSSSYYWAAFVAFGPG
jgi:CHAT domain-containing protein